MAAAAVAADITAAWRLHPLMQARVAVLAVAPVAAQVAEPMVVLAAAQVAALAAEPVVALAAAQVAEPAVVLAVVLAVALVAEPAVALAVAPGRPLHHWSPAKSPALWALPSAT